jgi:Protein of unknown function (DUF3102)
MTTLQTIKYSFDYQQLSPDARSCAREPAVMIRRHQTHVVENIVAIGEQLIRVKAALPHGTWMPWLRGEFGWSTRTAQRFISVAEWVKCDTVSHLGLFNAKALYMLAAPSTPEAVRRSAKDKAEAGQPVTHADVERMVAEAKSVEAAARRHAASPAHPQNDQIAEVVAVFDEPEPQPAPTLTAADVVDGSSVHVLSSGDESSASLQPAIACGEPEPERGSEGRVVDEGREAGQHLPGGLSDVSPECSPPGSEVAPECEAGLPGNSETGGTRISLKVLLFHLDQALSVPAADLGDIVPDAETDEVMALLRKVKPILGDLLFVLGERSRSASARMVCGEPVDA